MNLKATAAMFLLLPHLQTKTHTNGNNNRDVTLHNQGNASNEISFEPDILKPDSVQPSVFNTLHALLKKSEEFIAGFDRMFPRIHLAGVDAAGTDNLMEKLSYNKGDDANSVEDFAKDIRKEYTVFANKNALENFKSNKGLIMIYGEMHVAPLLPSVPDMFLITKGRFFLSQRILVGV